MNLTQEAQVLLLVVELTSLLHGGGQDVLPRRQGHEEGEGNDPQADGEVGQHLQVGRANS